MSPIGVFTSGKGSSAAGLTASVIRDNSTGEFFLEGGAMVLADGGVVCIDEFDKMNDEDRVAIHEAMEQQTISIAKAGITTVLNSRAAVLAAANPIFGRFDSTRDTSENIDFSATILSRFDMIFLIKDEYESARDISLARHVLSVHMQTSVEKETNEISIDILRKFISFARSECAPRLNEVASAKLIDFYTQVRASAYSSGQESAKKPAIPLTVRQLEAIIRIAESIAKINLSPLANEGHLDQAIELFKVSTLEASKSGHMSNFLFNF